MVRNVLSRAFRFPMRPGPVFNDADATLFLDRRCVTERARSIFLSFAVISKMCIVAGALRHFSCLSCQLPFLSTIFGTKFGRKQMVTVTSVAAACGLAYALPSTRRDTAGSSVYEGPPHAASTNNCRGKKPRTCPCEVCSKRVGHLCNWDAHTTLAR